MWSDLVLLDRSSGCSPSVRVFLRSGQLSRASSVVASSSLGRGLFSPPDGEAGGDLTDSSSSTSISNFSDLKMNDFLNLIQLKSKLIQLNMPKN